MKTKNSKILGTLISGLLLFSITGCLKKDESAGSAVEERTIISSGGSNSKSTSLNPSVKSWPALPAICSNSSATKAEFLVCELDSILDDVAKSGKTLTDFEKEIATWIHDAADLRNQVCKSSNDVTFLVYGTMQVLAGRNLIKLPFAVSPTAAAAGLHPLVFKIIYIVLIDTLQMGCDIDKSKLQAILAGAGAGSAAGPVAPGPGTGGGPIVGPPNPGSGGSGSASAICVSVQQRFKFYCDPHCSLNNSCDPVMCDNVKQVCVQNKCSCI